MTITTARARQNFVDFVGSHIDVHKGLVIAAATDGITGPQALAILNRCNRHQFSFTSGRWARNVGIVFGERRARDSAAAIRRVDVSITVQREPVQVDEAGGDTLLDRSIRETNTVTQLLKELVGPIRQAPYKDRLSPVVTTHDNPVPGLHFSARINSMPDEVFALIAERIALTAA